MASSLTPVGGYMSFRKEHVLEIMSDQNRYFTAQALERAPTTEELIEHWVKHNWPKLMTIVSFEVQGQMPLFME